MENFYRGSEWRKWDLHIHTSSSFDAYKGEDADELLIKSLRDNEIAAAAITDHFLINDKHIEKLRSLAPEITFFPGVELRTDKGADNLHIILIFSEKSNLNKLKTEFYVRMINDKAKDIDIDEQARWVYEDIIEFAQRMGALVTIHAGKKENGLDREITNATPIKMAIKKDISENIHFFEVGKYSDIADYHKHVFRVIEEKPIIICSDNHDPRNYTTKENLWIKADPTFEGLIQCIYQPQERVYVGNLPPKLDKTEKNKKSYIDSLRVWKNENANNKDNWFNFELPINSGLTSIIGNKGSGKSALSDTFGHLCNCNSIKDASFLNKKRFRKIPKKYADDYSGEITWLDGQTDETSTLGEYEKPSLIENAQYLPQKYIEKVCNELDDEFQIEINNVIFSYIDTTEKGEAKNLNELIKNKTAILEIKETEIQNALYFINERIIKVEHMSTKQYSADIKDRLNKKQDDLKRHSDNKPKQVEKPEKDPSKEYSEELKRLSNEIEIKEKKISEITSELRNINSEIIELKNIGEKLSLIIESINNINQDFKIMAGKYSFDIDSFQIRYTTPKNQIETKLSELKQKKDTQQLKIDSSDVADEKTSLFKQLQLLKQNKEQLISKTDNKEKAYQKYLNDLKEWEAEKEVISGNQETPDSIEGLKKELEDIKELPKLYVSLKKERLNKIKQLFNLKQQKAKEYESIYYPVEKQLINLITEDDQIQFAVNISLSDKEISDKLLEFIDKTYKGVFQSKAGAYRRMDDLIKSHDFNISENVCSFISSILESVYEDIDASEQKIKDKQGFYTLLTSLDYLDVEYNLKVNDKELEELSAGERGSVLLMFYLALSKKDIPIIIDQPEDNLDNQSVFNKLVPYIKQAKRKRQIIIVTHNPNIAVACDAEQIIHCSINKKNNSITYISGSIENKLIRDKVIEVLEGTMPAFTLRRLKYTLELK